MIESVFGLYVELLNCARDTGCDPGKFKMLTKNYTDMYKSLERADRENQNGERCGHLHEMIHNMNK